MQLVSISSTGEQCVLCEKWYLLLQVPWMTSEENEVYLRVKTKHFALLSNSNEANARHGIYLSLTYH